MLGFGMPVLLALFFGCAPAVFCGEQPPAAGQESRCDLPDGRSYRVFVAEGLPTPTPVVLVFHGGGGNAAREAKLSCPSDDLSDPACLTGVAAREGFLIVYPDGTGGKLLRNLHTWNAGGGDGDWQCTSGQACKNDVDDVAYVREVLADLSTWANVDSQRVYATGLSNGGAMTHRVACELADDVAAIAPVASGNQVSTSQGCFPSRPVPVFAIHGTEDPCWSFAGGPEGCAQQDGKNKVGIEQTLDFWVRNNACSAETTRETLPDTVDDGTTTTLESWQGCAADVVFARIEGGGHTWPNGNAFLSERRVGRIERDWDGNQRIWDFFRDHPMDTP